MMINTIQIWHQIMEAREPKKLAGLLADDVVFISPVVHIPLQGASITIQYLTAAMFVFGNESFQYLREMRNENCAVLEFETTVDGIVVNGVDIITWNSEGKIIEFKVMVRPLQAVNMIHNKMGEMLHNLS